MSSPKAKKLPAELLRVASRSHGIGLRPDEKELWMCDVFHDRTYVFDLTVDPPKQMHTISMKGGGYWLCFSPDGKNCYISERIGDAVAVDSTHNLLVVEGNQNKHAGFQIGRAHV